MDRSYLHVFPKWDEKFTHMCAWKSAKNGVSLTLSLKRLHSSIH